MQSTQFLKITSYGDLEYVFTRLETVMNQSVMRMKCMHVMCVSVYISCILYCDSIVIYYVQPYHVGINL